MRSGVSILRLFAQLFISVLIKLMPKVAKDFPAALVVLDCHQVFTDGSIPPTVFAAAVGSSGTSHCNPSMAGSVSVVVPDDTQPSAPNSRVSTSVTMQFYTLSVF